MGRVGGCQVYDVCTYVRCMVYGVWEVRILRSGYMVRVTGCGVRARFWLGISISISVWCYMGGWMYVCNGGGHESTTAKIIQKASE